MYFGMSLVSTGQVKSFFEQLSLFIFFIYIYIYKQYNRVSTLLNILTLAEKRK